LNSHSEQPGAVATAMNYAEPFDPPLLGSGGITRWLGPVISLTIFGAVLFQLRHLQVASIVAMVPKNPLFWLVFAVYYLATPTIDFLIFRRLWGLPPTGFGALLRKLVGNEILLGYIGEVHFYSWARAKLHMVASPFAAVKDVAILSAVAGNIVTLVVLAAAYPFLGALHLGLAPSTIMLAVGITLGTSLILLMLRGRLLTLETPDLVFVTLAQFGRVVLTTLLPALLWHLVLPQVAIGWWLLLAAMRLLLSRLPLLPNKDFVFAGVAVLLVGSNVAVDAMMTMMASLILGTHVLVGAVVVLAEFARGED
jgi:hypothetical protein